MSHALTPPPRKATLDDVRVLGPYSLLHLLGAGGMGEVWAARLEALGGASRLVAIKTLLPSKGNDPIARKMFLEEARVSMLLRNSGIVQVYDAAEASDGTCYLVMELVDGIDLAKLAERMSAREELLPIKVVAYIIGELLKALAYAHEFHHDGRTTTVVHRDISPHNVMLSTSGEVKLMDFGVARLASEETTGNFVKGKIRYMPPEQIEGDSRQPSVDLFALGAVLHELLDGKKFRGGVHGEARLIGMVARGEIPPLCRPERAPPELERLRLSLLVADPSRRIAGARAAHRLLCEWPGYRDARFELEALVRTHAGTDEIPPLPRVSAEADPREGLVADPVLPLDVRPDEATVVVAGDDASTNLIKPPDSSSQATRERVSEERSNTTPLLARRTPKSDVPSPMRRALLGASLVLTGLVAWQLYAQLGRAGNSTESSHVELPTGVLPVGSSPTQTLHASEPDSPSTAVAKPDAVVEPERSAKPEPSVSPTPSPSPTHTAKIASTRPEVRPNPVSKPASLARAGETKPKRSKTRVTVSIKTGWVKVRVDGKGDGFELSKKTGRESHVVELSPGLHDFEVLEDDTWIKAGRLDIPADRPTRVSIEGGKACLQ